jgi:CRISPR-associated endonuclease Csn1
VPGQNWCMDIVSVPDGKGGYIWQGFEASVFDVNQEGWRPLWERQRIGGKLVMRLHKGDLIELEEKSSPGVRVVKRVVSINPSASRLYLAGHFDGGNLKKRHDDQEDPFRWDLASISGLKERRAVKRSVNEIGGSTRRS